MNYYPIFLNLQGRLCVVIGGGQMATEKVHGLLAAEARVRVITPEPSAHILQWVAEGAITCLARRYLPGDLAGAFLAISATDDGALNTQVWEEAQTLNIPVNVVDDTPHCNFIAPSIARRGDLTVAISTSGKAPALAVRLREKIEAMLGTEHARFLELASSLREPLAQRYPDFATRKALWYQLVDSDVLELLRECDETAARQRIHEIMGIPPA